MSDEDDGLPVLTQVLRIGSGRTTPVFDAVESAATEPPLDEILLTDQLVIGTEPHQDLEPYVPLTTSLAEANGANDDDDGDGALREPLLETGPAPASTDESTPVASSTHTPFDHDAFALRVREDVMNDLSARIDTEFDARIAQTLHAELEAALASLQDNLREQLAEAIRDVVRRAVDEQVARMRETRAE